MIDAILTGMTGRISTLHKVQPVQRVKSEQTEPTKAEEKAPSSLDNVTLSSEALELYNSESIKKSEQSESPNKDQSGNELTEEEQKEVDELKARDSEVRSHEQAHMSAGAPYTSAPTYEYTTGPDSQQYATGGEVNVDTSEASTPEETVQKAQVIKRAASAPSEPSSQDRKVAAQAAQMEREARAEMRSEKSEQSAPSGMNMYGIAQYAKNSAPTAGSLLNLSF